MQKVDLAGVQGTLLVTALARATDAESPKPILNDRWSSAIISQISYDFQKLRVKEPQVSIIMMRAKQLDAWTAEFIAANPKATVLHLACGLDSRAHRVGHGPDVRWIDVDLPEVVELRKRLLPPLEGDYSLVAADVTSEAWLKEIQADRPTIVVFEGLCMYIGAEKSQALIASLAGHFLTGQLAFDAVGWLTVKLQSWLAWLKVTGTAMTWSIDDPKSIEALHGSLKLRDSLSTASLPGFEDCPLRVRAPVAAMRSIPGFASASRVLRYDF